MPMYTRRGDKGYTVLPSADGTTHLRLRKNDARLAALGALDELNAAIGLCVVEAGRAKGKRISRVLLQVQDELFQIGAMLTSLATGGTPAARIKPSAVARIERLIDAICRRLGPLEHFILPGGCELAGRLHLARTIARRAERAVIAALDVSPHTVDAAPHAGVIGRYLNRLSDLLFVLARANHDAGTEDVAWPART